MALLAIEGNDMLQKQRYQNLALKLDPTQQQLVEFVARTGYHGSSSQVTPILNSESLDAQPRIAGLLRLDSAWTTLPLLVW
jgi:hypothetical protein